MSRKQKKMLVRILLAGGIFLVASVGLKQPVLQLAAFLLAYFLVGWDVLWKAIRNIARGQVFDENFLMTIATVGAFFTGEFPEGVAVMLFYQVGEWFQSYAVGKSRKSIAALMEIRPDYANVERDGALEKVDPAEVAVGDVIVIKAGEKIPLDGVIIEGTSSVDTAALTGEALPRDVACGDEVISGCVNQSGLLRVQVTKVFAESTVAKILDLVENAAAKKAKAEQFITKFARYYTPAVVGAALLLAVVPPLFVGGLAMWVHRALIFLVISCPCALVISVPLSFFGGIGGASKNGILIKGSNYIEVLARTKTIVFDKTGTLTKGTFRVAAVHPEGCSEAELLELTALAEAYSDHPISRSVREAYGRSIDHSRIASVQEHAGRGVEATLDGRRVCAGNSRLMEDIGAAWRPCHHVGTTVHVAIDGTYAGHIVIADEIKPDAKEAIAALKKQGVEDIVMLTGDTKEVGEVVAKALDIPRVRTQLLPAGKVEAVEELLAQKAEKTSLAFVGDGINDAPVLSRADIGIAMGGMGSDAAIEAADVVLMDDCPSKISQAIAISKKTMKIVHQNIVFALAVKAVVLVLGACGYANMWAAVFADVGVSTLAILNAMRALKTK